MRVLSFLRRGRFVVTKSVEAESFCQRWFRDAAVVPLFPCFDGFSRQPFVAQNPLKTGEIN